ncbi:MAG: hypothetical protein AAF456_07980 [Planctomycetota bacterium]
MSQPSSDFPQAFDDPAFQQEAAPVEPPPQVAPQPVYRKQSFNVYGVMLILSFIALMSAGIILLLEAGKY